VTYMVDVGCFVFNTAKLIGVVKAE